MGTTKLLGDSIHVVSWDVTSPFSVTVAIGL